MAEEALDDLLLQLRIAVGAGDGLPGVTAPRLYCHPSVEYRLLACPPGPYAYAAAGRDGYLLAVTGGVPVEVDRSMEPGAWRLVLSEGRLERRSET